MRKMRNRVFVLFLMLVGVYALSYNVKKAKGVMAVKEMGEWSLEDMDGNEYKSDYVKGNVVVLHFWATWCGDCVEEVATLKQMQKKYEEDGLKVVGVLLDLREDARVERFVDYKEIEYPVLRGDADIVKVFGGVDQVPVTFVMGKDGKVLKVYEGKMDGVDLEAVVLKGLSS